MNDKRSLPIVAHESVDAVHCCGRLIVIQRDAEADLVCNGCAAVVKTVPFENAEQELVAMVMSQGVISSSCEQCGGLNTSPGFQFIRAFVCRECGAGNVITTSVQ